MNDYILFDLDGTLTDPKVGITTCVQYALASFGIEEPDPDRLTPFIGPPLKESFMEFYGFDEEKAGRAVEKYRERFQDKGMFENEVYEGVPEMLKRLKAAHKKLAVASSKPQVFVERILEHFGIRQYFDAVVGSELDGRRTDKAEVVAEALRQLYTDCEELPSGDHADPRKSTVMVGDRKFDVEGAKAAGIVSVAVSYGYGEMDELKEAKPDYIARSVEELEKLLMRGNDAGQEPPLTKIWSVLFPALIYYFIREAGFYVGSFLVLTMADMLPAGTAEKLAYRDESGALAGVTGNGSAIMATVAFAIAGIVMWKYFAKEDIGKAGKELVLKHSRLKKPVAYVCMAAGTLGMAVGLNFLFELAGITNKSEAYTQTAELQYAAALPLGLLLNGLVAPAVEEMVFRGVIYNRLKKYMSYLPAVLISALAFGVYHQNMVQGAYAFLMGCIIAYLYESFGHFFVPVLAHMLSNISAYLLTATGVFAAVGASWPACIVLLAAGAALLLACLKLQRPVAGQSREE